MKPSRIRRPRTARQRIGGFLLFEVLVSILVFSFGILGIVGLMSVAVKQSSGAKYRADASLLANELIGQMWVGDRRFVALNAGFNSPPAAPSAAYTAWVARVLATLPNAAAPQVTVAQVPGGAAGARPTTQVTVNMSWAVPGENPNSLVVTTRISERN
jgi:type IV pilus assembly protein PilV